MPELRGRGEYHKIDYHEIRKTDQPRMNSYAKGIDKEVERL